jgi:hypothetical protein
MRVYNIDRVKKPVVVFAGPITEPNAKILDRILSEESSISKYFEVIGFYSMGRVFELPFMQNKKVFLGRMSLADYAYNTMDQAILLKNECLNLDKFIVLKKDLDVLHGTEKPVIMFCPSYQLAFNIKEGRRHLETVVVSFSTEPEEYLKILIERCKLYDKASTIRELGFWVRSLTGEASTFEPNVWLDPRDGDLVEQFNKNVFRQFIRDKVF